MDTYSRILPTPLGDLRVYGEGGITRTLEEGRWWDEHLNPILNESAGGVAIDIGAHFGWFTIYLAQRHNRVIAVEPFPPSFQLLTWNVQRRPGLEHRIQCWPVAAYNRPAVLEFGAANTRSDPGTFGFTPLTPAQESPVAALPLDPFVPQGAAVSVIKCDAQGADLRALMGLRETILRCRPVIVFEWEEGMAAWQGDVWQDYLDFFTQLNYTVDRITPHFWDYVARPQ